MTINKQARKLATLITGVEPEFDGECLNYVGLGKTLQYRQRFNDWVFWNSNQLEGTLIGNDIAFLNKCGILI